MRLELGKRCSFALKVSVVGAQWHEALEWRIRLVLCQPHSGGPVQADLASNRET